MTNRGHCFGTCGFIPLSYSSGRLLSPLILSFRSSVQRVISTLLSLRLDFPVMVPHYSANETESQLPPKFRRMIHNGDSSGLSTSHDGSVFTVTLAVPDAEISNL